MSTLSRESVFLILQFLEEEKFKDSVHRLEQESGFYFNMKYFEEKVHAGEWGEVEKYLSGFTKLDENRYSLKIFFEIRKQKYLEALDRQDKTKGVEILVRDLKVFSAFNEDLFKEISQLLTLTNFRENEQLSKYGDTKTARSIMLVELKKLIEANPLFREKLVFPGLKASRLRTLMNQSLNWQHQLCKNPRPNPDIKTLFTDHTCSPSNGTLAPTPVNLPAPAMLKPTPYTSLGGHGAFPPTAAAAADNASALAGWMANAVAAATSSSVQAAVVTASSLPVPPGQVSDLKRPITPPPATPGMIEHPTTDHEQLMKRLRTAQSVEEVLVLLFALFDVSDAMDSTIVVKVKHGNTVRRFSARVLSNGLEFNFDGLRNKIRGLFNFSPDADFVLTYSDEDNDKITLVDDEDLMDVVRQKLNPLRILVTLRTENVARTPHESESVTTLGAPVQNPIENLNSAVIKLISSLPEPMGRRIVDSLTEPLRNGAKKVLSDFKTEKGLSSPSRPSESGALTDSSVQPSAITLENFLKFAGVIETGSSTVQKSVPDLISNEKYEKLPSKTGVTIGISNPEAITKDQSASKKKVSETNEVVKSRDSKESTIRRPILKAEKKPETLKAEKKLEKEMVISKENGSVGVATKSSPVVGALKLLHPMSKSTRDVLEPSKITEISGLAKKSGLGSFEKWNKGQPNAFNYAASPCPFSGTYIGQTSPYHGRNGYTEGPDTIFHYGVQCDGCGVHPISGIRYKSNKMADYDLCSICFTQMGEGDYIRIDRPGTYHYHNRSLNGLKNFSPRMYRAPRVNPSWPRLDSIFIQDVTILDGALMTPSTPFTKIWRMKNNGSVVWPKGTRLIWIGGDKMDKGGDKMGKAFSVDLEISGIGLPVGHELDIAADFIAPDFSGRYMSYWMMMSPTGQKFGQRVWVLIQVDAGLKVVEKALRDFNLNNMPPINTPVGSAPPVSGDIADVLVFNGPGMLNPVSEWSSDKKKVDLNFPIDDNLLVGGGYGSSVLTGGQPPFSPASLPLPPVTYPNNDLLDCFPKFSLGRSDLNVDLKPHINDDSNEVVNSEVVPPMPQPLPPMAESEEENDLETNLLMELDRMGFKEIDLNKEVLRLNEYDLEKCLNDLCGVSEWDPILEELHEMGFNDDVMNKKLLEKNKGSVTQVVLDLLVDENE